MQAAKELMWAFIAAGAVECGQFGAAVEGMWAISGGGVECEEIRAEHWRVTTPQAQQSNVTKLRHWLVTRLGGVMSQCRVVITAVVRRMRGRCCGMWANRGCCRSNVGNQWWDCGM